MTDDSEQTIAWIGLSSVPGVGRVTFRKLVETFGSPRQALDASVEELTGRSGISEKVAREITTFSWREPAQREVERARAAEVSIVTQDDPGYPVALKSAVDGPLLLYIKGSLLPGDDAAVALVGTRTPTHYGTSVALRMADELASAGMTIVSGMARGIDTQAHKGALDAHGRTIAVLGCGIDVPYPPENRGLMERIAASGAVVTENPFGTRPESGYFPARNRIISGLSRGTVIIEAAEDSGSLITADYTLKQGRRLFAVPGNVSSPVSRGTNSLIKQGALLVETAADVLSVLRAGPGGGAPRHIGRALPQMSEQEAGVFASITADPKHIDVIMTESGSSAGILSGLLIGLELKGLVKQLPGKYFVRADMQ
jgi:DNA processing protein